MSVKRFSDNLRYHNNRYLDQQNACADYLRNAEIWIFFNASKFKWWGDQMIYSLLSSSSFPLFGSRSFPSQCSRFYYTVNSFEHHYSCSMCSISLRIFSCFSLLDAIVNLNCQQNEAYLSFALEF